MRAALWFFLWRHMPNNQWTARLCPALCLRELFQFSCLFYLFLSTTVLLIGMAYLCLSTYGYKLHKSKSRTRKKEKKAFMPMECFLSLTPKLYLRCYKIRLGFRCKLRLNRLFNRTILYNLLWGLCYSKQKEVFRVVMYQRENNPIYMFIYNFFLHSDTNNNIPTKTYINAWTNRSVYLD